MSQGWRVHGVVLEAALNAQAAEPGDGLGVIEHVLGQLGSEAESQTRGGMSLPLQVENTDAFQPKREWVCGRKGIIFNRQGQMTDAARD